MRLSLCSPKTVFTNLCYPLPQFLSLTVREFCWGKKGFKGRKKDISFLLTDFKQPHWSVSHVKKTENKTYTQIGRFRIVFQTLRKLEQSRLKIILTVFARQVLCVDCLGVYHWPLSDGLKSWVLGRSAKINLAFFCLKKTTFSCYLKHHLHHNSILYQLYFFVIF